MGWKERDAEVMHLDAEGNRDAAVVALLLAGGGLGLRRRPSLGRRGLGLQPGVAGCWGDGGLGRREARATAGWGGDGWVALSPSTFDGVRLERRLGQRTYVGLERWLRRRDCMGGREDWAR